MTTSQVEIVLKLNEHAKQELTKIEELDFNIFKFQQYTSDQELVGVATYILCMSDIFGQVNLGLEVFLNFIRKIQGGYKDIPYHNKTHAADLV